MLEHPRPPTKAIHLRVEYGDARSLVTAYTTSVSKGGCTLKSARPLSVGTAFVFQMFAPGVAVPVEVQGTVVRCDPTTAGGVFDVEITYATAPDKRAALQEVLDRVLADHQYEKLRKHPRVPVNLVAHDADRLGRLYLVRDISLGGLGMRLPENVPLPEGAKPGTASVFSATFSRGQALQVRGRIAWLYPAAAGRPRGGIGIAFEDVTDEARLILEALVTLERPSAVTIAFK